MFKRYQQMAWTRSLIQREDKIPSFQMLHDEGFPTLLVAEEREGAIRKKLS